LFICFNTQEPVRLHIVWGYSLSSFRDIVENHFFLKRFGGMSRNGTVGPSKHDSFQSSAAGSQILNDIPALKPVVHDECERFPPPFPFPLAVGYRLSNWIVARLVVWMMPKGSCDKSSSVCLLCKSENTPDVEGRHDLYGFLRFIFFQPPVHEFHKIVQLLF
jgi:hypothetical protein